MDVNSEFIRRRRAAVTLEDGTSVIIRPVAVEDKKAIVEGFRRLSPQSRHFRFLQSKKRLTRSELKYLTEVDYANHFAWCAETRRIFRMLGIGIGRYIRLPDSPTVAEVAVTVVDAYQGRGLGSILLWMLSETAVLNGIRTIRGYTLPENRVMIHIFKCLEARQRCVEGILEYELGLPLSEKLIEDANLRGKLQTAVHGEVDLHSSR